MVTKYLLDTNILIALFIGKYGVQRRVFEHGPDNCLVSELSLGELYVGAYKYNTSKALEQINFVKNNFETLPFSGAAEDFGRIRAELELEGKRLEDMDLLLAATAVNRGLTLVTHNVRHFSRIPGVLVEDWFGDD